MKREAARSKDSKTESKPPADEPKRPLAAIDIGSSTVHLLVAESGGPDRVRQIASESVELDLGQEVSQFGRIRPKKAQELNATIGHLLKKARKADANEILIGATRALRAASNGTKIAESLSRKHQVPIPILSSLAESRLTLLGVQHDLVGAHTYLVVDSGGGSTEVMLVKGRKLASLLSIPVGSSQLCALLRGDPPRPLEWGELCLSFADHLHKLPTAPRPTAALVLGGTAHRIADLADSRETSLDDLDAIAGELLRRKAKKISKATDIPRKHVVTLSTGILIIHAVVRRYGIERIRIGQCGVREGMILAFDRLGHNWFRPPANLR
jgi:exopolyphosphatase/pppGpp-phosphohydrolase